MFKATLVLLLLTSTTSTVLAQESGDAGTSSKIEPLLEGLPTRLVLSPQREIAIHRQARWDQVLGRINYFHQPLLTLDERDTAAPYPLVSGLPAPTTVHRVHTRGDRTYLEFIVRLSSDAARQAAASIVKQSDDERKTVGNKWDPDNLVLHRWPITRLSLKIIDRPSKSVLATWTSERLDENGDTIAAPIGFDSVNLDLFLKYLKSDNLDFIYSYSFKNLKSDYLVSFTSAAGQITEVVENYIQSNNLTPGFLSQQHKNGLEERVRMSILNEVSTNNIELLKSFSSNIVRSVSENFLTSLRTEIDKIQDSDMKQKVSSYIQAEMQKYEDTTKKIDKDTKTQEASIKVDVGVPKKFSISPSLKNTIKRESGIEIEQSNTKNVYVARAIELHSVTSINSNVLSDSITRAYLARGSDPSMKEDSAVPASFTTASTKLAISRGSEPAFAGVQLGMAMCYLADGPIPEGYAMLDGTGNWPNENWVVPSNRGQKLPDVRGKLVGGASDGSIWATISEPGQIVIPKETIDLSKFSVAAGETAYTVGGGGVTLQAFAGENTTYASVVETQLYGPNLSGSQTLGGISVNLSANPSYLNCRWITRVR
jgi:hypothetical protein